MGLRKNPQLKNKHQALAARPRGGPTLARKNRLSCVPKPREIDASADLTCATPELFHWKAPVGGASQQERMDGSDLKVSDSSGSDRNPLRLPSERLLRRIETSGDLFAAAPEAFGLSEVVLGAHVALAQKLRRADASQLKIAAKVGCRRSTICPALRYS